MKSKLVSFWFGSPNVCEPFLIYLNTENVLQYSHTSFPFAKVASPPRCIACSRGERRLLVLACGPHNVEGCYLLATTFCLTLIFLSGSCGSAARSMRFTRGGRTVQHCNEKGFWRRGLASLSGTLVESLAWGRHATRKPWAPSTRGTPSWWHRDILVTHLPEQQSEKRTSSHHWQVTRVLVLPRE